jgi:hypothetical protein
LRSIGTGSISPAPSFAIGSSIPGNAAWSIEGSHRQPNSQLDNVLNWNTRVSALRSLQRGVATECTAWASGSAQCQEQQLAKLQLNYLQ